MFLVPKAVENMFVNTGSSFTGSGSVNTTCYTNNKPIE